MAKEQYRAKVNFHRDHKYYPKGKAYAGPAVEELLKQGLIEKGEGHNEPQKWDLEHQPVSAREARQAEKIGEAVAKHSKGA